MDDLSPGTVIADRYTIQRVVGRGGMAVVYEVINAQLGTPCALKVLALTARSVQARLNREGQVQSQLQHPNILSVFDVVDVGGSPGLLMELVRGPALDTLLTDTRLTLEQCDLLAHGILSGLGAAHAQGLIHRDLKPANILCSVASGQLIPKIADFGLAKIIGDESGAAGPGATRSGTTMGTPSYMAPEQIRNAGRVDQRADIFSVGAILYELVCGIKAFEGDDLLELFTAVANGDYVPPRDRRPDLPERMERAIVGALEPDRDKRIRDVATLQQVWNGDRDDWTTEIDPATLETGPWDPSILAKYAVSSSSAERIPARTPIGRSGGSARTDETLTADAISALMEPPEHALTPPPAATRSTPSMGSLSPQGYAFAGGALVAMVALVALATVGVGIGVYAFLTWPQEATAEEQRPPAPVKPLVVADAPVSAHVIAAPDRPEVPAVVLPPAPVEPEPTRVEPKPAPADPAPSKPGPTRPAPVVAPPPAPVEPPPEPVVTPPEPQPEPVVAAPLPPPEPKVTPGMVRVELRGDVDRVWLQGPSGNTPLPAEVLPGTYAIEAFFDGGTPTTVGQITVELGATRTLKCKQDIRVCR